MAIINFDDSMLIPSEPKRMLSIDSESNHTTVEINYSSLDAMQTCPRLAEYSLERGLRPRYASPPLLFGSAVHQALEVWYCSELDTRQKNTSDCRETLRGVFANETPIAHGKCARCSSLLRFIAVARESGLPEDEAARSVGRGVEILNGYFDKYLTEPFVVMSDDVGPLCERTLETEIFADNSLTIRYFGTIDMVLQHAETKRPMVVDHKTTKSLGKDFYARTRPNFQYIGYLYLVQKELGLDVNEFTINGLQVAKTVKNYTRETTTIDERLISEWKNATIYRVREYLNFRKAKFFPMSTPNACTMWGECRFKRLCEESNPEIQKSIQEYEYESN